MKAPPALKRFRKDSRGSVLLLTFFLLIILAMLGTGFLALVPVEMRSAQKDRSALQSAYGADAGVQSAMNSLNDVLNDGNAATDCEDIPTGAAVEMANGWSYMIEDVEEIGEEQFRITATGSLRNVVQRRVVALVDDGSGESAVAMKGVTTVNGTSPGDGWPTSVPVKGDILWMGTFLCNNQGFNMNNLSNPPFQGTIFQTQQNGDGLRDEDYSGTNPTAGQYPSLYTQGLGAVQPAPAMSAEELLTSQQTQQTLLKQVFNDTSGTNAVSRANAVPTTTSYYVEKASGSMTGGIYINDGGGNVNNSVARNFVVRFSAPPVTPAGTGLTTITRGDGRVTRITTIKANTAVPGFSGITGAPATLNEDRIAIASGTMVGGNFVPTQTDILKSDIDAGHVMYIDGKVTSMQGTYTGNRTIGVMNDTVIDGELLKSDTARGAEPTNASRDALGIVGTITAPNNSVGTNIKITNPGTYPAPVDKTYYIYAYLTGLDGNDVNGKLFKDASIPATHKVHLMGSLQIAPTNNGQMNHTLDFVKSSFKQVTIDNLRPFGFPGANRFVAQLCLSLIHI